MEQALYLGPTKFSCLGDPAPGISAVLYICMLYTGCNRRNGPDFGRVFLMLKYTDITQNTYVQS
jgi:hypothetical protein